jgi:hypothetical protein
VIASLATKYSIDIIISSLGDVASSFDSSICFVTTGASRFDLLSGHLENQTFAILKLTVVGRMTNGVSNKATSHYS